MIKKFLCILFCAGLAIAEAVPQYNKLVYENKLITAKSDNNATFDNQNGEYTNSGWHANSDDSRLVITFNDRLPQTGMVEFKLKGVNLYEDVSYSKQNFAMLTSSEYGEPDHFYTKGSWAYIRTGTSYKQSDGSCSLRIDSGSRGVGSRALEHCYPSIKWNRNHEYTFQIYYNHYKMWLVVDGRVMKEVPFIGQFKRFKQLWLGGDPNYPPISAGVYSNVRVYTNDLPEYFIEKTSAKNLNGLPGAEFGGHGITVGDVNGDGLEDMYIGNCVQQHCQRDILYIQQPDGTFQDETLERGVEDECCSHAVIFFDADNDGDLDLFNANTWEPNQLYINDGDGFFSEESFSRGIEDIDGETRGAIVFDVDNDGWLDIYAVNWGMKHELYMNQGDGTFVREDRGTDGIVEDPEVIGTQGVTVSDIDNDGDYDIYISKRQKANELYINNNGYFTEAAAQHGVAVNARSDGATFADHDNDGDMDLFVATSTDPDNVKKLYLHFLENNGNGNFTDKTAEFNKSMDGFTPLFFDANNDGNLDLYRLRNNSYDTSGCAILDMGNGDGTLISAGYCAATVIGGDARAVVATDFDHDGDQDLYITCKSFENIYLQNEMEQSANYLKIITTGPRGDYGGVGSKIDIYEPGHIGDTNYRLAHREVVTVVGYLAGQNLEQHFGLGNHTSCDIQVTFTDGSTVDELNVNSNQRITISAFREFKTLSTISGNNQNGYANQALQPFVAQIKDQDDNPVAMQAVNFEVIQGSGQLSLTTGFSDNNGNISVTFTPDQAGQHIVRASLVDDASVYTDFTATITEPQFNLNIIAGNNQTSQVGQALPQQLMVQLVFADNTPAPNQAITFQTTSGSFNGNSSFVTTSNSQGYASAPWTLGTTAGTQTATVTSNGLQVQFTATVTAGDAALITKISGDSQSVQPGTAFPQPFTVRITDSFNNPVSLYPVVFKVTSGTGTINQSSQTSVNTDENGNASVIWTTDPIYGATNTLSASATLNGMPISGSPIVWNYPGPEINAQLSTMTADSTVLADGVTAATITVSLKNNSGASAGAGLSVQLNISGSQNTMAWINPTSDQNGQLRATLKSTKAETKNISAQVLGASITLTHSAQIVFKSLRPDPEVLTMISGNEQSVAAGGQTAPFTVKVTNLAGEPVPEHAVEFVPLAGFNTLPTNTIQTVMTDDNGLASASFQISTVTGVTHLAQVQSNGLANSPMIFSAVSIAAQERIITVIAGDQQTGYPGEALPQPLTVQITDIYKNPAANRQVTFTVKSGDCLVNGQTESIMPTNASGGANVIMTLGSRITESLIEIATAYTSTTVRVYTIAKPAVPDLALSTISATSPIFPDGKAKSQISVTIVDEFSRPLEDIKVSLMVIGQDCQLTFTDSTTDANGQVFAQLASTTEGEKLVMALLENNVSLEHHAVINFTFGEINFAAINGNQQTIQIGQTAPQPLQVQLTSNDQPISGKDILFRLLEGNGRINNMDSVVVKTDNDGKASVVFSSIDFIGTCHIQATTSMTATPVIFTITVTPGPAAILVKFSGDEQSADINETLPLPLQVKTTDISGNPVAGTEVTFSALTGGSIITPQPVVSNDEGVAETVVQLDTRTGQYYFQAAMTNGANVLFTASAVNQNTAPQISAFEPAQQSLTYNFGEFQIFKITGITDPDEDPFTYEWRLNNNLVSQQSTHTLLFLSHMPTDNVLVCTVSDGKAQDTVQWNIKLFPTAVELSSFQAEFMQDQGVRVSWQTRSQKMNAGFDIERAPHQNGPWAKINQQRIDSITGNRADYSFTDAENLQPGVYFYRLIDYSSDGNKTEHPAVSITVAAPSDFALLQNYPNPFNPTTTIAFKLPQQEMVTIHIFNANGQLINQLVNGMYQAGKHSVVWNAVDDNGRHVPSGLYFYIMKAGSFSQSRKLLLMK